MPVSLSKILRFHVPKIIIIEADLNDPLPEGAGS